MESALLSALAAACGSTLPRLLQLGVGASHSPPSSSSGGGGDGGGGGARAGNRGAAAPTPTPASAVRVNGLLVPQGSAADAAAAAAALVAAGFTCLKVKVARRCVLGAGAAPAPGMDGAVLCNKYEDRRCVFVCVLDM